MATIMYWIIWDLADAMKDIDIAPPIQSRMYQERAAGAVLDGFQQQRVLTRLISAESSHES